MCLSEVVSPTGVAAEQANLAISQLVWTYSALHPLRGSCSSSVPPHDLALLAMDELQPTNSQAAKIAFFLRLPKPG